MILKEFLIMVQFSAIFYYISITKPAFNFRNTLISSDLHILFLLPKLNIPHNEKIRSTKACEAGAVTRSSATGARWLYVALRLAQNSTAVRSDCSISLISEIYLLHCPLIVSSMSDDGIADCAA